MYVSFIKKYFTFQNTYVLEVLWFRAWNRFRNRILSLFQKIAIPIPIPVPTATGIDSKVESIPRVESIPVLESDPGLESIPIKEWDLLNSKRSSQRLNFQ